jgi:xanthine dehydrogenase small subunit
MAGREVTTLVGLPAETRRRWSEALVATGGSQCGFCTPGIVMRLAALETGRGGPGSGGPGPRVPTEKVDQALVAHLCRCTGWQTIEEAARLVYAGPPSPAEAPVPPRDLTAAAARARLEGGVDQRVGPDVVLGRAGFADDTCPPDALVGVPDGSQGGYAVAETAAGARALAGKVQGRSTGLALDHPVALPPGPWALTLRTTWVEPGYVEPDASWCLPDGEPASPHANGGAFGGKLSSPVTAEVRLLARRYGRPVRAVWSREDAVLRGPKRPPVAGGITAEGSGILRVGVTRGTEWDVDSVADAVASVAPGLAVELVEVIGPPTSLDLRAPVWAEAAVLAAGARCLADGAPGPRSDVPIEVTAPGGGRAAARIRADGSVEVAVDAGPVLDEVVLRSYCIGATHQALGWVRSEGVAVDAEGTVRDLTIRSFGILQARAMPPVTVTQMPTRGATPVNGSDAVFAAVAAARWLADGLPPEWPTDRAGAGRR